MPRRSSKLVIGTTLVALATAVPLSGHAASGGGTTKVDVHEWAVSPAPAHATAGKITFVVRNTGTARHEFVVIRTDLAPGKLPVKNGRASEKGHVGEIGNLPAGSTKRLTLTLARGTYVLFCNFSGHYRAGQHAGFVVR
jgi:uncharacterized cupredoxin-like copper-binding protein